MGTQRDNAVAALERIEAFLEVYEQRRDNPHSHTGDAIYGMGLDEGVNWLLSTDLRTLVDGVHALLD
jgi:hypothetical protein